MGEKDGSRWADAAPGSELQSLMDASPGNYEIWLAQGDYYPDENYIASSGDTPLNGRDRAFVLQNGAKIYGGFRGTETRKEPNTDHSKPENLDYRIYTDGVHTTDGGSITPKYVSRLTGTLPDGIAVYHTVIAAGDGTTADTAYLDGLTIAGSTNPYWPGTTITVNGKPIVHRYGGAFYINDYSPVLKNATVKGGLASQSAGVYITGNSTPVFLHCYLTDHQSSDYGSAIGIVSPDSHLLMVGGSLGINLDAGGVLYIGGKATLVNVSISHNKDAPVNGSGVGTFINCSIEENRWYVSYLPNVATTGTFYNSVIRGNDSQTTLGAATFNNTIITGATHTVDNITIIADSVNLANKGSNDYYPLNNSLTDWRWTSDSSYPEKKLFAGDPDAMPDTSDHRGLIADLPSSAEAMVKDALKYDGNGKPRLNGTIDLGALE
jgi:hypothetical protein